MSIALKQEENRSALYLDGDMDIAVAAELKTALLDALAHGAPIDLHIAGIETMDVTAVQLLWAAEREAKATGIEFLFADSLPTAVSNMLMDAGFDSFAAPEKPGV